MKGHEAIRVQRKMLKELEKMYKDVREMKISQDEKLIKIQWKMVELFKAIQHTLPMEARVRAEKVNIDELYPDAHRLVIKTGFASTSHLQRVLGIGYARAANLMDMLEERGVIGPADGSKPREVRMTPATEKVLKKIDALFKHSQKAKKETDKKTE